MVNATKTVQVAMGDFVVDVTVARKQGADITPKGPTSLPGNLSAI